MHDHEDKEIPKRQPRIFKTSEPFCKITEEELKDIRDFGEQLAGINVHISALRKKELGWWQWRARRRRRHEIRGLRQQIEELNKDKRLWWAFMRGKYKFENPAIVSIMRGEIILGTPNEKKG